MFPASLPSLIRKVSLAAAALVLGGVGAQAAPLIGGTVNEFAQYTPYNVSSGAADWAIWGSFASPGGGGITSTTYASGGPQSFTVLSGTGQGAGINISGGNGRIKLNYSNGAGAFPGSVSGNDVDSDQNPVISQGNSVSPDFTNLSFTHTLLAGTETINIILFSTAAHVDLSASLSSGGTPFSTTNFVLPTSSEQYPGAPLFYTGLLTLDISGAQAGDILTFTTTANYTGVPEIPDDPTFKFAGVGISAANVFATVPEPSILTLVCGAGALTVLRRRRRTV